jgi:hypothetical protein
MQSVILLHLCLTFPHDEFTQIIHTISGTHIAYIPGFESDDPSPYSAKTINKWAVSSFPPTPFTFCTGITLLPHTYLLAYLLHGV